MAYKFIIKHVKYRIGIQHKIKYCFMRIYNNVYYYKL